MIKLEIKGIDKVLGGLNRFAAQIARYMRAAGEEAANDVILPTEGLRQYPPATAANQPPTPYYVRGRGTQYKSRNDGKSQRLGSRFYVRTQQTKTTIGNSASYSPYVVGERQSRYMQRIGWRQLGDVAKEKLPQIVAVYQRWVDKLIKDLNL